MLGCVVYYIMHVITFWYTYIIVYTCTNNTVFDEADESLMAILGSED